MQTRPPLSRWPWTRSWPQNGCWQPAERRVGREERLRHRKPRPASGHLRFIEVKGRHADGRDVIVTKNEILASLNAPDAFILAIVRVVMAFTRAGVCAAIFHP